MTKAVEKKVKVMWWEGQDFHIVDEFSNHLVFRDCYIKNQVQEQIEDTETREWEMKSILIKGDHPNG